MTMNNDVEFGIDNLREWLKQHKDGLCEALGLRPFDEEQFTTALWRIRRYYGGHFSMFKDDLDRKQCDTLHAVLSGRPVTDEDLRKAVGLILQAYGGACDKIWSLERQLAEMRRRQHVAPRYTQRYPPKPSKLSKLGG